MGYARTSYFQAIARVLYKLKQPLPLLNMDHPLNNYASALTRLLEIALLAYLNSSCRPSYLQ